MQTFATAASSPDSSSISGSAGLRRAMVDCQIRPFDVTDGQVIEAFLEIPRENFVGAANSAVAYSDGQLCVSSGSRRRFLLEPMVLARLLQGARITGECRVLDVGGGNGYTAAILSGLAREVVALEADAGFTQAAATACAALGCGNVTAITGDLANGASGEGLFDVIIVNGAIEAGFEPLLAMLAPGGRLLAVRREAGASGRAARAVRFDVTAGKASSRSLFDAAGRTLEVFETRPAFAF